MQIRRQLKQLKKVGLEELILETFILVLKNSWKEFDQLKDIDQKFYFSDYYDVSVNKYGVKCGTSPRFWENNGWINEIDPYGWFQWYFRYWLGRRSKDDERQIHKWKGYISRFTGKLVKIIS